MLCCGGAGQRRRADALVADRVTRRLLSLVLRCADELGGAVRARPLRRAQQLVRPAPRLRQLGGDVGAAIGAGLDAADRASGDAAQGWRAGWLAIGAVTLVVGFVPTWLLMVRRPEDLGLLPDGMAARTNDSAGRRAQDCRGGARLLAAAGARHRRVLAAAALYRPGLSGAGRGQPAPGALSDRARHRPDDRGDDRQHLLGAVGGGDGGLRARCPGGSRSATRSPPLAPS